MTDFPTLSAELTRSLTSLWTRYAGKPPTDGQTEIRGNVVTCVLSDAVADFNRKMIAPRTGDTVLGVGKLTPAGYKREAIAAVVKVTRQRVASFASDHDRKSDVATEVFTLEPSLSRGAPPAERRGPRFGLRPPRAERGPAMDSGVRDPTRRSSRRLVDLEAGARYARERYQLYRAKAYGPRLTSAGRLRELERQSKLADRLLARAKADAGLNATAGLAQEPAATRPGD